MSRRPELADALDRHADATCARLADTVIASLVQLAEPPPTAAIAKALYTARLLAETLAGFAIGAAASELIDRVRAADPPAAGGVDRDAWRRSVGASALSASRGDGPCPGPVLADAAARPLVDELGVHLLPAVQRARPTIHRMASSIVADLATPLARAALDSPSAFDGLALRFADQIDYGWQTYRAALTGAAAPAIAHERSRDLWRTWLRRIRHERRVRPADAEREYVLRVA